MKKLSILLLVLCLLLPAAAMAVNPAVEIDNVPLPNGYYMASGTNVPVVEKPDGGYAYLKDDVLTLCNYSYSTDVGSSTLEVYNGDLTIELIGSNQLINRYEGGDAVGLLNDRSLTIGGSGSLKLGGDYGIYCYVGFGQRGSVTVNNGNVEISVSSLGIMTRDLTIGGGNFIVVTTASLNDVAIRAQNSVQFLGGTSKISAWYIPLDTNELVISGADTVVDFILTDPEPSGSGAIRDYSRPTIDSPLQILIPEGGTISNYSNQYFTVMDPDGRPASHVRIAAPTPVPAVTPTPAPVVTPTPAPTVPATGDHADLTLWLALAVLTMTGAVLIRKRAYR